VREPSSNAFLYLHFQIGDRWIVADHLRRLDESLLDEAEEEALAMALYVIHRRHLRGKTLDSVEVTRMAADLVARRPITIDQARERIAELKAIAAEINL